MGFLLALPGLFRTAGCVLVSISEVVQTLPIDEIAVWAPVLAKIGGWACGAGVVRAGFRFGLKFFKK